ncbi:zinc finger protein 878-like isoform X39 [Euwallacea similis]|uniref:zinc finger protein 878-like isoform X39 n=1 Tax=Euwallacea similis TaxID=1736056 RepID=UPI00344DB267
MDNPGEILRLCRLCLVKDQVNIPIFEEQGDIRQTFLKIRSCLPVKVSRDDKLPKKICGGCSNKLDLFYEFWSSTANSEKTLQSWLGQEEEDDKMQEITKPVEALVKEESEALEDGHAHDQSFDEATKDEAEAPPAKRARRTAAVKAQINISHDSDEDEDVDGAEPITKIEDESDDSDGEEKDPSYTEVPGTSADDQAGPSGLGKDGVEAPLREETILLQVEDSSTSKKDILNILFWCHICGKCFRRKIDLNKHFAFVHFGDKKFECTECNLRYKDEDSYLRHKKRRHEPKLQIESVLCHSCGAVFKSDRALERHALNAHSNEVEDNEHLKCDLCEKSFEDRAALRVHLREHPDDRVRKCQVCEEVFFSLHKYRYHVRIKHELDTYYFCQVCKKLFPSATRLKVHEKTHDEDHERIETECPICQKWVKYLKSHMDNVHSTEMSTVCEVCGKGFKKGWDFKKHLEKHSEEEKFKCSKCEVVLNSDAKLKKHEKTHAKLVCSKCGKRFFKGSTFEKHLKQHLG